MISLNLAYMETRGENTNFGVLLNTRKIVERGVCIGFTLNNMQILGYSTVCQSAIVEYFKKAVVILYSAKDLNAI